MGKWVARRLPGRLKSGFPTMIRLTRLLPCVAFFGLAFLRLGAAPRSTGYFEAMKHNPAPEIGHEYYLAHCLKFDGDSASAVNYWRGTLLPINTKVKLVAMDSDRLVLHVLDTGETVKVNNKLSLTRKTVPEIAQRMLSPRPIDLSSFDRSTRAAIKSGILQLGMTREQVVMARGYPPGEKTPDLDLNRWVYWSSRFIHQTLLFSDGVLARGRGIE